MTPPKPLLLTALMIMALCAISCRAENPNYASQMDRLNAIKDGVNELGRQKASCLGDLYLERAHERYNCICVKNPCEATITELIDAAKATCAERSKP